MAKLSNTSEEILACARGLIVAGGYNAFSYADIADVVGIRKASIHHHFPNKVDLVKALVVQHRQATEEGLGNLRHAIPDAMGQLRAYVGYWEQCISDLSAPFCICALLAGELPVLPAEIAVEVRAYFRFLSGWMASVLEQGMREGTVRSANGPQVEAEVLMASIHGAMLSARAYGDVAVFATVAESQLARYSTES
ncbi:TetR/AcrR family transcriptional regulator [Pseudoduganella albidiflava]|uniref:TetR family transcriptional regulator n=1 Tax=Pseudoduganella albidiflava TaxID=321983 RepID=A0A411WRU7_9BURK|nr:TetR/AcrR family transcriptional regulator [Pseudoduganella albidiflava]QBH99494.1 TetR/AcrR family transcriptional regulator [Pseudoduganella albidiflava]GGY45303.1 TetR family transcriptional regulator [Pseudoduganella albidiflava]